MKPNNRTLEPHLARYDKHQESLSTEQKLQRYFAGEEIELSPKQLEIATGVATASRLLSKYVSKLKALPYLQKETGKSRNQCYQYFRWAEYCFGEVNDMDKKALRVLMREKFLELARSFEKRAKAAAKELNFKASAHYDSLALAAYENVSKYSLLHKEDAPVVDLEVLKLPDIEFTNDPTALEDLQAEIDVTEVAEIE